MFEVFEHTADLGLRVRAAGVDELFAEAARGLFSLMVENPESVEAKMRLEVNLNAASLEDLFFDWLAELLYLFDARRLVFCQFEVRRQGTSLHAQVGGEEIDPARHRFLREIKAVTYHGLAVRPSESGWMAQVIVDI
jgi:SHS2 domain-containing protein